MAFIQSDDTKNNKMKYPILHLALSHNLGEKFISVTDVSLLGWEPF